MKIGKFDTSKKVFVIAEIGNNHEGDFSLAKELVSIAAEAGADAVKFQYIIPEKLILATDRTRIDQLNRFKLKKQHYISLSEEANRLGVEFLCTPFDLSVVDFLDDLVAAFKIASGDNNFFPLIDKIVSTGKPVITSLGLGQINHAKQLQEYFFDKWQLLGHKNPGLGFLHCVCSYPTPIEKAGIMQIDKLKSLPVSPGYSDHTLGTKACELAVARGARIIEKHFTKNKDHSPFRDHQLSADQKDLIKLVNAVRTAEKYLGSSVPRPGGCEEKCLPQVRRAPTVIRDLKVGEILSEENLAWLRGTRTNADQRIDNLSSDILGAKLRNQKKEGEVILPEDISSY